MEYFTPKGTNLKISRIAHGCMRIAELTDKELDRLIKTSVDSGINFFDHADIYAGGLCEEKFGNMLKHEPSLKDKITIQTKCGIVIGKGYDFRPEYLLSCVEGSLKRLGIEQIDVLLLHRPDALCEPEKVAAVFDKLQKSGKVRYFGVSNHNPYQIELLQKYCSQRLIFNQLQFGPAHTSMIDAGIHVNMADGAAVMRDGLVLDYCRLNDITIQPWSPFSSPDGMFLGNPKYKALNEEIERLSKKYNITDSAVVLAWILRHPAKMQPIVGTTNAKRIADIAKASQIELTHDEWYGIYRAAGNDIP
ncbi:MAG: aldo/keto reductase [Clostridia bacterium]|nr:aldo/keto reductase [Clostridia bacterium]